MEICSILVTKDLLRKKSRFSNQSSIDQLDFSSSKRSQNFIPTARRTGNLAQMKITDVKAITLRNKERSLSAGPGVCMVEVHTSNGLVGIGEACAQSENDEAALATALILERGIKPIVLGLDPVNPRTIWEKLYLETEWFGRMGTVMHAISALDIALWDLMGKSLGVSVSRLIGGRFRESVKTYASIIFDMENFASMADEAKYLDSRRLQSRKVRLGSDQRNCVRARCDEGRGSREISSRCAWAGH